MALSAVQAYSDLTNVDLINYQYFKYPTEKPIILRAADGHLIAIRRKPTMTNRFVDTINRTRAVFKYFKDLFFGTTKERTKSLNIVKPESTLSQQFQAKHGKFGEKLVELLGSGASREELIRNDAISQ